MILGDRRSLKMKEEKMVRNWSLWRQRSLVWSWEDCKLRGPGCAMVSRSPLKVHVLET
jgi:hypothetical protein